MFNDNSPSSFSNDSVSPTSTDCKFLFSKNNIVGEGASSQLHICYISGGEKVAVKRLRPEHRANPIYVEAFHKEFSIGWRLKHNDIPTYREFKTSHDDIYIVMEYIDGTTLNDFLRSDEGKGYFNQPGNAVCLFSQLLNILEYLHRVGVIHCDIKAANIILRRTDHSAVLIDFDKAYSGSFDRTHGGSEGISSPVRADTVPAATKDFEALGILMEYIVEVTGIRKKIFKRFINECRSPQASIMSLRRVLNSSGSTRQIPILAAILAGVIACATAAFLFLTPGDSQSSHHTTAITEAITDTVLSKATSPVNSEDISSPIASLKSGPTVSGAPSAESITEDFEQRIAPLYAELEEKKAFLRSGKGTHSEITNQMYELFKNQLNILSKVRQEYIAAHPEINASIIGNAVDRRVEKSRLKTLLNDYSNEVGDTLRHRKAINNGRLY